MLIEAIALHEEPSKTSHDATLPPGFHPPQACICRGGDGGGGDGGGDGGEGSGEEAGGGLEGGGKGGGAEQVVMVPDVSERPVTWKVHMDAPDESRTYTSAAPLAAVLPEKVVMTMDTLPLYTYIPPP